MGKVESFLPKLARLVENYPKFQYPAYFQAKLLLALGDREDMLSALLPFAKKKKNDFWVWEILSEAFPDDEEKVFGLYCKALSCHSPEEMLINLRQKMAALFIIRQLYNEARTEIELLVTARNEKGYKILGESISLMGPQSSAAVVLTYMQASQQLFKDGAIDAEKVLVDYESVMDIVDANIKLNPDDEGFKLTKDQVEIYFTNSGAATCDALVKLFTGKFAALKDDLGWLKKVTKQLKKAGCTDTKIFSEAAEAQFKLEPTAEAAHNIAFIFLRREETERAAEYLQKGIDIGQQSEELADMYYELASLNYSRVKNYQKARQLALKAIEARPNWGKPYLLIGQMYIAARQEVFTDPWDQATVFWVAVDKFIKAKSVDPEVADEANNLINTYSEYFPNNEMVFFRTMRDGDTYSVGGWINETTKVRSKKL